MTDGLTKVVRHVLESEPIAVAVLESVDDIVSDFRFLYVNQAYRELKPQMAFEGQTFCQAWPERPASSLESLRQVMLTGSPWTETDRPTPLTRTEGEPVTRYLSISVSRVTVDRIDLLVVCVTDTTQRALAVSHASRLGEIVDHMSDAFIALDSEWRFTYLNDKALSRLHVTREQVIGHSALEVLPQFAGTEWEAYCRRAMEERISVAFELYYEPDDNWTEVRVYPTSDGIALYYSDITRRKRNEAAVAKRMGVVNGINEILHAALSAESEAQLGLESLRVAEEISESPFGFIAEVREDGLLHDIAVHNPGWDECAPFKSLGHDPLRVRRGLVGLHGQVILTGKPLYTNEPIAHPARVGLPPGHPPLSAFLGIPLIYGGETFGLIGVGNRSGGYDDEVQGLLETLAPSIVESFERFRAGQMRRRRDDFNRALNDVSDAVHSTLDIREILQRTVLDVAEATGLNGVGIHLRGEGEWEFSYTYGFPEGLRDLRLDDEQAIMSMQVVRSSRPLVIRSLDDAHANRSLMETFDIHALIGVPLVVRGEPFGVLFAGQFGRDVPLSDEEVDFLQRVSSTLALALENARLYEGEHHTAETLQQALLALPERVKGITFAHAYRSASEAAYVGGDFYDIFEMEYPRVALLIGDVAGKGIEAAVLTYLIKNAVRAFAGTSEATPDAVLKAANDMVYRVTPSDTFATAFLAFLNYQTGKMTYSSAGHTTSLSVHRQGGLTLLPGNSPLLGAFSEAEFKRADGYIDEDDLLLMYTDGVVEARGREGLYGEDRLFDTVAKSGGTNPSEVIRSVIDDVMKYTDHRLGDDLAMMAVRRLGRREEPPSQQRLSVS